jgi:cyclase
MMLPRVIPVLLLRNGGLVKTIKFKDPKYVGDPINAVRIFNDKGADELTFLDITATRERREPDYKRLIDIASECFMPLAFGGGIHTIEAARKILSIGCEKVIVNSIASENPEFVRNAANVFGSQSVVVSIDVKKNLFGRYEVWTHCATKNTGQDPVSYARRMEGLGAGELFLCSIDRDGVMKGYDIDLIKQISTAVAIPIVACGGAGTVEDLGTAIFQGKASAVAAGSMFVFHGKHRAVIITYPDPEQLNKVFSAEKQERKDD